VDVKAIMNGTAQDIPLKRNDVLYIPSIHDLEDIGTITVTGEVARPGTYAYAENTTLEDLMIQAGGLKESASTVRVDISRRLKDSKATEVGSAMGELYTFSIKDGYVIDGEQGFVLKPYDQVYVRRSPGYSPQVNVTVEGEVNFEGDYALTSKSERLSELVKKTGGLTKYAYAKGAKLMRIATPEEIKRMQEVVDLMRREVRDASMDSLGIKLDNVYPVGIDLVKAMENPGSSYDIVLREGDRLIIPEYTSTVKINGAVMMPNTVTYKDNKSLKYYVNHAGGYSNGAKKSKAFVIYMNGDVAKIKGSGKGMIEPGCEIVIPVKDKSNNFWNLTNVLGLASSLGSLGLTAAAIANIFK
jgi:protein involved in polysaccharide export with SLBB domain